MAESEFKPPIHYAPNGGGGGGGSETPSIPVAPEEEAGVETERLFGEQAGTYPIEGRDLVELLMESEIGENGDTRELEGAIREALAFREGLKFGPEAEAYDLKGDAVIFLQNLFSSVEGLSERPNALYVQTALDTAIGQRAREALRFKQKPGEWKKRQDRKYKKINRGRLIYGRKPLTPEQTELFIELERNQLENAVEALARLQALQNHIDARQVVDGAFIQRMGVCENPELTADLTKKYSKVISPDKGYWKAYFDGEWGEDVNTVFWEIVVFGLPDEVVTRTGRPSIPAEVRETVPSKIYASGFERTEQITKWISPLLEKAGGDMSVVLAAWRLALLWEVANEIGVEKEDERWNLAFPPIGNSLFTYTAHFEAKRAVEFGLKPNGEFVDRADRFVSHSGLPMSLGKFPALCRSFLHESRCKFKKKGVLDRKEAMEKLAKNLPTEANHPYFKNMSSVDVKMHVKRYKKLKEDLIKILERKGDAPNNVEVTLWELGFFGRLSFASKDFPWLLIEESRPGEEAGELPPGSFGDWFLRRTRCWSVILKDIRARPSLSDLADPDFFAGKLRNWNKILGPVSNDPNSENYLEPEDNPRAWWVAGLIWYHTAGTEVTNELVEEEPMRNYRSLAQRENLMQIEEGILPEKTQAGVGDSLRHAMNCGFLRQRDANWILKKLGISLKDW